MELDLQKDQQKIIRFIKNRIRDYPVYENLGPGKDADPIQMITLGYYLEQEGYFALVFDTRREANPDGEWTLHLENGVNMLPFRRWYSAFDHLCEEGTVEVTLPGGKKHVLDTSDDNESVAKFFGQFLRDTMLQLRDDGALASLPLSPSAYFVVEEFDGNYGWPDYEKRKSLGSLVPKKRASKKA